MHICIYRHIHIYKHILLYTCIYIGIHAYTLVYIRIHLDTYKYKQIHAYTDTKYQYMYVYVCIFVFLISSFFQGKTRKCQPSEEIRPLKCTGKKLFKMMQNAIYVFRSRTPVSTANWGYLYH